MEQRVITVLSRVEYPKPGNNQVSTNDTTSQISHFLDNGFYIQTVATQLSLGVDEGTRQNGILATTYLLVREND
ncbi:MULTISPECIES: hypothetical protein [Rufibacter]|uniref:Uncharacterized protein n=1 Tax=Rufibacter quisquiliarum TaxID=1549639 RepID=A0A839GFG0_9BACT|nr:MULTISPECIES: hypothetical protein [Rufibacter]MBA9075409.1 hypothetical protein [Rufibacter quisquiliarum]